MNSATGGHRGHPYSCSPPVSNNCRGGPPWPPVTCASHASLGLDVFIAWTNRLPTRIVRLSLHERDGGGAQVVHDADRGVEFRRCAIECVVQRIEQGAVVVGEGFDARARLRAGREVGGL